MRSDPADYELVAPGSLDAVLTLLAKEAGAWLPIAGGTDVMVQYAAGRLGERRLVSLWNLPELRTVEIFDDELRIGAACTYSDLRSQVTVEREFPLLTSAARVTGGIANQNRGTIGGNIVNASPAADSLPALLVYEAELILVSARGDRRVRYLDFHTGYKKTLLAPDELIRAICLKRSFAQYLTYSRKVGARNAQAIAKVCMAAAGKASGEVIEDVRIAVGSVAPVPLRLRETEIVVLGMAITPELISRARERAIREIRPIDDIRSTAAYRAAVVGNLVGEFLNRLIDKKEGMSHVLARWNGLPAEEAAREISACCGSAAWAREMAARRPFQGEKDLVAIADEIWSNLPASDWLEAFSKHPRIGERKPPQTAQEQSAAWSGQEQQKVAAGAHELQLALAEGNREYEKKFDRVFIVSATGKSATEILEILRRRLENDDSTEFREAAEEQRKITNLRLRKWLWE